MRQVVINGDYLAFTRMGGVGRYASELLAELDKIVGESDDVIILTPIYTVNVPHLNRIKIVKYGDEAILKWKHSSLPTYIKSHKALLVDLTQAFTLQVKGITCVHDCIPELVDSAYIGFFNKFIRKPIKLMQRRWVVRRAKALITVSETSKKDIARLYHKNLNAITVVPNAWQHIIRFHSDDSILNKYNLKEKSYIFTLGSRVSHKNIRWIIVNAIKNKEDLFVVSGENSYDKNFENEVFPGNIIFTGYITDEEIKSLMIHCKAFVLPSLYEGFGIPPLEALALGCKIIVSNTSCLPEIYEDSAYYIKPDDYMGVNLDNLLNHPVGDANHALNKYSWEKSANILYDLIKKNI